MRRRQSMIFTGQAIKDLDLESGEIDVWVWDCDGSEYGCRDSGLGLRMRRGQQNGISKTFYGKYNYAGTEKRLRLGDTSECMLADARFELYLIRRVAEKGHDPQAIMRTAKLERRSPIAALNHVIDGHC